MATISFQELDGSPEETYSSDGFRATMRVMCAWNDRRALAAYFLTEKPLYERRPDALIRCRSVGVAPYDHKVEAQGGVWGSLYAKYSHALLTVEYTEASGESGDAGGGMVVEESIDPAVEFLTQDYTAFSWEDDGTPPLVEANAPAVQLAHMDYRLTFSQARIIPNAALTLMGHVNDRILKCYTLPFRFAVETVLYHPPLLTRTLSPSGATAYRADYRWTIRHVSWNLHYKPGRGWSKIYVKPETAGQPYTEYKKYPLGNLATALPRG